MTAALLETKLHIPRLRQGSVGRPRLTRRMVADARLTLISAPAGFGKTTLLTAWLHEPAATDRSVAWVSLDATNNEPTAFWTYLATALDTAVPGLGTRTLSDLAAPPAHIESVLTTLLNDLAATPGGLWLVLDDYHQVDSPEINKSVAFLLERLPVQAHVVISTRADPDLPLARWRVRGELVEIRAADLRFTSAEATAYLTEATGLQLAAAEIAVLEDRTEGWIAALQLAALSLQGREDASDFIARFAGDHRYIVDYLIEEVLQHQTDTVRRFLLQSAVLDRLTGPLCDAVTGGDEGSEMLTTLDRANLFIIALDDRREWYRYHHLFADVLRARMLSEQPDLVAILHLRASEWYELHDQVEAAVRHALAGRDFDRAARLVELAAAQIRRHRQEALWRDQRTTRPVPAGYQLRVDGHLDQHWASWFGLTLTHEDDGTTCLTGAITDQAQLHGLLARIRDLGVILISVDLVDVTTPERAGQPTRLARSAHVRGRLDPSDRADPQGRPRGR